MIRAFVGAAIGVSLACCVASCGQAPGEDGSGIAANGQAGLQAEARGKDGHEGHPPCVRDPQCDDGNPCTQDRCRSGTCLHVPDGDGVACDDHDPCTRDDRCRAGACVGGDPVACVAFDDCHEPGRCDPHTGVCSRPTKADGAACEDGNRCTLDDTCRRGHCKAGPARDCVAPDPCLFAGTCKPSTGECRFAKRHDGTRCQDGDACTQGDTCRDGACVGGAPVECDDGDACTRDSCDPAAGCVHATFCDDRQSCTIDSCIGGICHHRDLAYETSCDDGNPCTTESVCRPTPGYEGTVCSAVAAVDCEDGDPCTADWCEDGRCIHGAPCTDGPSCAVGRCDPVMGCQWAAAADGTACGASSGCGAGATCAGGECRVPAGACDDGDPCTDDTCETVTGLCLHAARNCDDGNPCTEDTCAPADGTCLHPSLADGAPCGGWWGYWGDIGCVRGTCLLARCRYDYNVIWSCDDGDPCTADHCGSDGQCVHDPQTCDDGNPCTQDRCSLEAGGCEFVPLADGTPCPGSDPCTAGSTCQAGGCLALPLCDDGDACTSDSCGTSAGTYSCHHASPYCNDGNPCTDDACDPASGQCTFAPRPDGASCDDGNACTEAETCADGWCQGMPVSCDDGDPCTDDGCDGWAGGCQHWTYCDDGNSCTVDSCDPETRECRYEPREDGTPCDDGNPCSRGDSCQGGWCQGASLSCDDGDPCTDDGCDWWSGGCWHWSFCDDGNPCTRDSCDPQTRECRFESSENGTPCDDQNACSTNDACQGGACVGETQACDDGDPCTLDGCDPAGGCGHWNPCQDGNPCTTDACDPTTGECGYEPVANGTGCDDGNPCTPFDGCQDGTCMGIPADCADGDACTEDSCSWWQPTVGSYVCVHVTIDCNDGNPCTTDACDHVLGCLHVTLDDGIPCDDGNACTVGDACQAGQCGVPVDCDDGDPCTQDGCDAYWGCQHFNPCDDGNPCTHDGCDGYGGCLETPEENGTPCDDGTACTAGDTCVGGACGVPLDCDDGDPCSQDWCDAYYGCQHYSPCDDGNPCTADSCTGSLCTSEDCPPDGGIVCVHAPLPDGGACLDGSACTTGDTCQGGRCTGAPVDCSDGDPCTKDQCRSDYGEEGGFECSNPPDDCNDGSDCTADRCEPGVGCAHDPAPDGQACHNGCPGPCGFGTTLAACQGGACTEMPPCDPLPTAWGPAGVFASLAAPPDTDSVHRLCHDFTGDGLGDSGLKGLAGQLNGPLSDSIAGGALVMLLEFPDAFDFADQGPFELKGLLGVWDTSPPMDGGMCRAGRISYASDCTAVNRFQDARLEDGVLEATAGSIWLGLPTFDSSIMASNWPSLIRAGDVALRGQLVQGGPEGVRLDDGVLSGVISGADWEAFVARAQAGCDAALPDQKPAECAYLSVMHSALPLLLDLHQFPDGTYVTKSKDAPGNAGSFCLTFTTMPVTVVGVVDTP